MYGFIKLYDYINLACILKLSEGLLDCIIYRSAEKETQKNRGFAFLEYDSHKSASNAKRKLGMGRAKVWGCDIIVDWADPMEEPDDETMQKVRTFELWHVIYNNVVF